MLLFCLRKSREAARAVFLACGSPARLSKSFFNISGTPRDRQSGFSRLRDFRKSVLSLFLVCGTPANQPKRFLVFAGLPRARRLSLRKGGQRRPPWRKRRPPGFCAANSSENRPNPLRSAPPYALLTLQIYKKNFTPRRRRVKSL